MMQPVIRMKTIGFYFIIPIIIIIIFIFAGVSVALYARVYAIFHEKKMLKLQIEGAVFWCVVINYISTISICEYEYTYVLRSCCPPELFIYSWYLRQCNLSHRTIIPVRMIKNTRIQITLRSISICIIWIEQLIYLRMKYIDANTTSICYRIYF